MDFQCASYCLSQSSLVYKRQRITMRGGGKMRRSSPAPQSPNHLIMKYGLAEESLWQYNYPHRGDFQYPICSQRNQAEVPGERFLLLKTRIFGKISFLPPLILYYLAVCMAFSLFTRIEGTEYWISEWASVWNPLCLPLGAMKQNYYLDEKYIHSFKDWYHKIIK